MGEFNIPQVLVLDETAQRYKLYERDGSVTEFDAGTGMFCRRSDPAGNWIEVTALNGNGYNITQVERSYTDNGQTTTEQFLYEYANFTGDQLLEHVTLRRKVGSGNWTNVVVLAERSAENGVERSGANTSSVLAA